MRRADIISASLLLLLGLVTILVIIPAYVAGGVQSDDLSPALMPYVAAVLGTAAMALLLVARLAHGSADDEPTPLPKESWYFVCLVAALLAGTFLLMSLFGYLAGASAIVAGFMALARADWKVLLGTAIALPFTLWLLFDGLLGFPLP